MLQAEAIVNLQNYLYIKRISISLYIYVYIIYYATEARRLATYVASDSDFGRPLRFIHSLNGIPPFSALHAWQHGTLLLSV